MNKLQILGIGATMLLTFNTNGNTKQLEACKYWADKVTEQIAFGGAKYGGKSFLGCKLIFSDALTYPDTMYFIARETLNDLRKFTIPSVYEVFDDWGIDHTIYMKFNGQDNYFNMYNGSKVYLLEAKYLPSDPDYHRFGSIQMTRGWCEEFGQMDSKAIQMLWLTIGRWKNAEYGLKKKMLLTCNPHKGYGYTEFYLPSKNGTLSPEKKFIISLPQDNKSGDQDYIKSIMNNPDKNQRERLGFGNWEYDDDPSSLVDFDAIQDMWTNEHIKEGDGCITTDIAMMGSDKFVITVWKGFQIVDIIVMDKSDGKEVETAIKTAAEKYGIRRSRIVFDNDGIGSFLSGSILKGAQPFNNGASPKGSDNYSKLKDQCGYKLAERIQSGGIYIKDDEYRDEITREVEQLKSYKTDDDGKLRILPKKEIKKQIGHSPDFLDTLIMREYLELQPMNFKGSMPKV